MHARLGKLKYARQTLRKLKYAYQTIRKLKSVHRGAKNKEQRTQIKYTSVNGVILLFGLEIITTVCSSSDLVGSVSLLGVWGCGLLLVLLLRSRKVQGDSLYRLLSRTGLPWTCPVVLACYGFLNQLESSAIEKRAGQPALVTSSAV